MILNNFWQIIAVGMLGGALVETMRWYKLRESIHFPKYASSAWYWCLTIVMICIGGALPLLYGAGERVAVEVLHMGASAPAFISTIASKTNVYPLGEVNSRKFLSCSC